MVVVGYSDYSFKGEEGRLIEGIKIYCIEPSDFDFVSGNIVSVVSAPNNRYSKHPLIGSLVDVVYGKRHNGLAYVKKIVVSDDLIDVLDLSSPDLK
jgi:hypothetical protein